MSETHQPPSEASQPTGAERPAPRAEPEPETAAGRRPPWRGPGVALWLALILVLLVGGIAASPFWAPELAPLLPWAGQDQPRQEGELAARVERLEALLARIDQLQARLDKLNGLSSRVEKLETLASRPDKSADFAARLDRIDAAAQDRQQQSAATTAALQKLDQRLTAVEARLASPASESPEAQQQIDALTGTVHTLGGRLETVENVQKTQAGADQTDTGLLLILLQMRDAVAAGRPFAGEYDAFAALANDRPEIAKAAAPLAGPAQSGVAGREVLRDRLAAVAATIAQAKPTSAAADWKGQAWASIKALVTIRRIAGSGQSPPEAAVSEAQLALAQGDLAAAIGKLKGLTGAHAAAAKPWIDMAENRLETERALGRVEQSLTVRLAARRKPAQP